MRNSYIALESGWIPGHPNAFQKNAVGKIQYYDAVEDAWDAATDLVEDVVDFAGDVVDVAVDVVEDVVQAAGDVIQTALDDPIRTIATIAAIAAGQPELIPYINAADTLASGGDFDDALKSAAISYAAQGAGSYVGGELGTALEYGTDPLSAQTAQLAAQSGDMLGGTTSGTIGAAAGAATAGATAAALSGGDIDQAIMNALGSYFTRTGVNYTINAAGELVDQYGNKADASVYDEIGNMARDEYTSMLQQPNGTIVDNGDGTFTQTFDDGSTITTDSSGNVVSSTTSGGETAYTSGLDATSTAPTSTKVDNGDGTFTQTFDDGSTITVDENGSVIRSTTIDGEIITPADATATFVANPTIKDNGDGTFTQTFDDGSTLTTDANGNVIGSTEATDTGYDLTNVTDAAKKYFTNQFTNQLANQLYGGIMGGIYGKTPGGTNPYGSLPYQTSVGLPKSSGIEDYLAAIGIPSSTLPGFTIPEEASKANESPISLWNPGVSSNWVPETKLGGLGFAGQYINQQDDSPAVNKEEEDRQKLAQEIRNRGWMTDEERIALEQGDPYFSISDIAETPVTAAKGGLIDHNPEFYSEGGTSIANRYVKGSGDGTSDSVPAMLASGEFVIPADVVSNLGNGDNDAGAKVLDEFMKSVRQHKRAAKPDQLPPDSKGPLSYVAEAKKKVGKKYGRT